MDKKERGQPEGRIGYGTNDGRYVRKNRRNNPRKGPPERRSNYARPTPRPAYRPHNNRGRNLNKKRRPVRPVRRDVTLVIFDGLSGFIGLIKNGLLRFSATRYFRPTTAGAILIAVGLLIYAAIGIFNQPNGVEVFFDNQHIGVVRWEGRRDIDDEYIRTHATARLESHLGSTIRLAGDVTANPIRVGNNVNTISFDSLMAGLLVVVDYYVYGAAISIDGTEMATLSSRDEAEDVLARVARHWGGEGADEFEFVEFVNITELYIHRDDLMDANDIFEQLISRRSVRDAVRAQSGDSFYLIARAAGMTLDELLAINPDANPPHLDEGDVLFVNRYSPMLSVKTIEHSVIERAIPALIEIVTTNTMAPGQRRTTQAGSDGLERVTVEIVRVNGVITEERTIDVEIVIPATTEIVMIGSN